MSPLSSGANDVALSVDLSSIARAPRKRISESEVPQDASGLVALAENGSWSNFSTLAQQLALKGEAKPHQVLQFKLCHVLGLLRRRDYVSAHDYGSLLFF